MKQLVNQVSGSALADELGKLIAFRPVTGDHPATHRLLKYVKSELAILGLKAEIRKNDSFYYLLAGTLSLDRSRVLLQSHVDVVPAESQQFKMQHARSKLAGRGTYDMLFAVAVFLAVLRRLHNDGMLHKLDIGLMLSSDEETGGHKTSKPAIEAYVCDVCFLPDAGGKDILNIGGKGVLQLEVLLDGKAGHAGRPLEYDNPVYKLGEFIPELRKLFTNSDQDKTVCSITTVKAGDALNQTPGAARLTLDIRFTPQDDPKRLIRDVSSIAGRHNGRVRELVCEPAFQISSTNAFIKDYARIYEARTGRNVSYKSAPGSSDARFFCQKQVPVIMARPEGGGLHGPNEWVSLASLIEYTDILHAFLEQFGRANVLIDQHR